MSYHTQSPSWKMCQVRNHLRSCAKQKLSHKDYSTTPLNTMNSHAYGPQEHALAHKPLTNLILPLPWPPLSFTLAVRMQHTRSFSRPRKIIACFSVLFVGGRCAHVMCARGECTGISEAPYSICSGKWDTKSGPQVTLNGKKL